MQKILENQGLCRTWRTFLNNCKQFYFFQTDKTLINWWNVEIHEKKKQKKIKIIIKNVWITISIALYMCECLMDVFNKYVNKCVCESFFIQSRNHTYTIYHIYFTAVEQPVSIYTDWQALSKHYTITVEWRKWWLARHEVVKNGNQH